MRMVLAPVSAFTLVFLFVTAAFVKPSTANEAGEALFKQHCAVCHPEGKNIINPQKTLYKKDRDANNIKSADDIIKTMRNPGRGMIKFDEITISEKQAHEIAEYVVKTFN